MQDLTENQDQEDRNALVERLKKQTILLNHGRLLQILINVFSEKETLKKLKKREGQEIQINFPYDLEVNCLTFVLSESPSDPFMRPSENPKAIITFNVPEDKLIPLLVDIVATKYSIFGILKLLFKYVLMGKIRFKPKTAIGALIATLRCFLVGGHELVDRDKVKEKLKRLYG